MLHKLLKRQDQEQALLEIENLLNQVKEDENRLTYVLNLKDNLKYTPLHTAIFARNLPAVKLLVSSGADVNLKCHGTPPMHLAIHAVSLPGGKTFGEACIGVLLQDESINLASKDDLGNTIIHLAAEFNVPSVIASVLTSVREDCAELVAEMVNVNSFSCQLQNAVLSNAFNFATTPLHKAAFSNAVAAARLLLDSGARMGDTNAYGMNALHIAADTGSLQVWQLLVSHSSAGAGTGSSPSLQELLAATDSQGNSPQALAARNGWGGAGEAETGAGTSSSAASASSASARRTAITSNEDMLQHHTCKPFELFTNAAPPENARRLDILINPLNGALRSAALAESEADTDTAPELSWTMNSRKATIGDVLRVHEWSYVRRVQARCEQIESSDPSDINGMSYLDSDTAISKRTFDAALTAAGSVCQAVDQVCTGAASNVFCPIRPPGHHAGPKGVVPLPDGNGPESHGFCILNNISIGSAYALNQYRDTVKKVAIVDFDVHHGNGTEETVRWLQPSLETVEMVNDTYFGMVQVPRYKPWFGEDDPANVMFISVHGFGPRERPSGMQEEEEVGVFYPGSGKTSLPWTRRKASGSNMNSNPISSNNNSSSDLKGSGSTVGTTAGASSSGDEVKKEADNEDDDDDDDDDDDEDEDASIDDSDDEDDRRLRGNTFDTGRLAYMQSMYERPRAAGHGAGTGDGAGQPAKGAPIILDVGVPLAPEPEDSELGDPHTAGGKAIGELTYRNQWRNYFRESLFPKLLDFEPDMIFISAGFDAHKKDGINAGYISLTEDDFYWITANLKKIANTCCEGRVVSALEGGYQLGGEYCSAFARSVKAHVNSLSKGVGTVAKFSVEESAKENEAEQQLLGRMKDLRTQELLRRAQVKQEREAAQFAAMEAAAAARAAEEAEQEEATGGDMQAEEPQGGNSAMAVEAEGGGGAGAEEEGSKKRRRSRAPVDYAKLDEELRGKGAGGDAAAA